MKAQRSDAGIDGAYSVNQRGGWTAFRSCSLDAAAAARPARGEAGCGQVSGGCGRDPLCNNHLVPSLHRFRESVTSGTGVGNIRTTILTWDASVRCQSRKFKWVKSTNPAPPQLLREHYLAILRPQDRVCAKNCFDALRIGVQDFGAHRWLVSPAVNLVRMNSYAAAFILFFSKEKDWTC